jgi:hypothetical protein
LDTIAIGRSPFYFSVTPPFGSTVDVSWEWQLKSVAESDQIVHDSKPSLEDLWFLSDASAHKRHCAGINETDSLQICDTTADPNAETACGL